MINLLQAYFLTSNEIANAYSTFYNLEIYQKGYTYKTFSKFKSYFFSLTIQSEVPYTKQFFYLWQKITSCLCNNATGFKIQYNQDIEHLEVVNIDLTRELKEV